MTISWINDVKELLQDHQAIQLGYVEFFVLPSYPLISEVSSRLGESKLKVGSQNISSFVSGPFTGEVSPKLLGQLGSKYSAIGHHERKTLFAENQRSSAEKVLAALQNGITPILCLGELDELDLESAMEEIEKFVEEGLILSKDYKNYPIVIAYEPCWAIGSDKPASSARIRAIAGTIKSTVSRLGFTEVRVIYGGSAGPGLFTEVGEAIDGLFLGRSVHKPEKLVEVVDEIWSWIHTQNQLDQ